MKTYDLDAQELKSFTVAEILKFMTAFRNSLQPWKKQTLDFEKTTSEKELHKLIDSKNLKTNRWAKFIIKNGCSDKIPVAALYGIFLRLDIFIDCLERAERGQVFLFLNVKTRQPIANPVELALLVVLYRAGHGIASLNVPVWPVLVLMGKNENRIFWVNGTERAGYIPI